MFSPSTMYTVLSCCHRSTTLSFMLSTLHYPVLHVDALPCPSSCQPYTTLFFMLSPHHYPFLSCCHRTTTLFFHVVNPPPPCPFMLSPLHYPVLHVVTPPQLCPSCCHPSTTLSFMLSPLHNPVLQQCFLSRFIQSNRGIIAVQINNLSFKDDHTGSQKQELRGAIGWLL